MEHFILFGCFGNALFYFCEPIAPLVPHRSPLIAANRRIVNVSAIGLPCCHESMLGDSIQVLMLVGAIQLVGVLAHRKRVDPKWRFQEGVNAACQCPLSMQ